MLSAENHMLLTNCTCY